jgi:hypothetical protein
LGSGGKLGKKHIRVPLLAGNGSVLEEGLKQPLTVPSIPVHCMLKEQQMNHKVKVVVQLL